MAVTNVVASRLRLIGIVTTPGKPNVRQTCRPRSPLEQLVLSCVVEITDAVVIGAEVTSGVFVTCDVVGNLLVAADDPIRTELAIADDTVGIELVAADEPEKIELVTSDVSGRRVADDPARAALVLLVLTSPLVVGKTPASTVIVPRGPISTVRHTSMSASSQDVDRAVIVVPEMIVLVGNTAGLVIVESAFVAVDRAGRSVAPTLASMRSPELLVGRTPASMLMVPRGPRPRVIQRSSKSPAHEVEIAVIAVPEIVVSVARAAELVIAGVEVGGAAEVPPVGRTPTSMLTVPRGPTPRVTQRSSSSPAHEVEIAVTAVPEIVVSIARAAELVVAGVEVVRAALLPPVGSTPTSILTVPSGPRPKVTQRSTRSPEQDVEIAVMAVPEIVASVVRTVALVIRGAECVGVAESPFPAPTELPSVLRALGLIVVDDPVEIDSQEPALQELEAVMVLSPELVVGTTEDAVVEAVSPIPAPICTMLPSVFMAPIVAVIEGPTPTAKHMTPSHWVCVAVNPPEAEDRVDTAVVGVAFAPPPIPRLIVTPSKMPKVTQRSISAPPQLVVVVITAGETVGRIEVGRLLVAVIPFDASPLKVLATTGRDELLVTKLLVELRTLLAEAPTPLVMEALALDASEEMAVETLSTTDVMLGRNDETSPAEDLVMLDAFPEVGGVSLVVEVPVADAMMVVEIDGTEKVSSVA